MTAPFGLGAEGGTTLGDGRPSLLIRAARAYTGLETIEDAVVVIDGDRIVSVTRYTDDIETTYAGVPLDRYEGGTALPGLVDAHCHLTLAGDGRTYEQLDQEPDEMMALYALRNLRIHLESGVTTLRDNGGRNRVTFVTREAVSRGYFESPKLLLSGRPITPSGGHFHWCNGVADGPDELRAAVRLLAAEGADHIKIMASGGSTSGNRPYWASYDAEELRIIVDTAHALQRLTTAHCRAKRSIEYAIEAGLDCIEHADFLVPPGQGSSDQELYGGISAAVVPIGAVDYDPRLTAGLAQKGIYVSFTFQAGGYDRLVELRDRETLTETESQLKDRLERYYEIKLDVFRRLMNDGVGESLVVSSDAGPFVGRFGHLHYGLELAVEAGMSPRQAIDAATRIAADACGVGDEVGTLEPGKTADVLIVDGDPLADIGRVAFPSAVYRAGRHIQPSH